MELALLDTDALSEIIKLRDRFVLRKAIAYGQAGEPFAFSAMTRYEIIRGYRRLDATLQIARFAAFCEKSLVLAVSDAVLDRTADLWAMGRRGGFPHEDADLIIAATALEYGRALVTGNTTHFAWIPGLKLEDWRQP